jgi:hypothetical protein
MARRARPRELLEPLVRALTAIPSGNGTRRGRGQGRHQHPGQRRVGQPGLRLYVPWGAPLGASPSSHGTRTMARQRPLATGSARSTSSIVRLLTPLPTVTARAASGQRPGGRTGRLAGGPAGGVGIVRDLEDPGVRPFRLSRARPRGGLSRSASRASPPFTVSGSDSCGQDDHAG